MLLIEAQVGEWRGSNAWKNHFDKVPGRVSKEKPERLFNFLQGKEFWYDRISAYILQDFWIINKMLVLAVWTTEIHI